MSTNHIVQLPKAVWGIKVAQTVIAAFVLIFAIVDVAIYPYSVGYNIFTVSNHSYEAAPQSNTPSQSISSLTAI